MIAPVSDLWSLREVTQRRLPSGLPNSVHLIGVGGAGMRALAKALLSHGVRVTGSDLCSRDRVEDLTSMGLVYFQGHHRSNIQDVEFLVVSSAISESNAEVIEAQNRTIPILHRTEMLAQFLRERESVLVAGTHGKTTTTTMIALAMESMGLDPWAFVGGEVSEFSGNVRCGGPTYAVAEADESDGTFLLLPGDAAIVTNIEPDHLDHWQTLSNLERGFSTFAAKSGGKRLVVCVDDPGCQRMLTRVDRGAVTYSVMGNPASFRAMNIELGGTGSRFDLIGPDGQTTPVQLGIPGLQNVANATGALAMVAGFDGDLAEGARRLAGFRGVGRRFTRYAMPSGALLVDDYAHHPTEIAVTIAAARRTAQERGGRLLGVFQPHRYTRTRNSWEDFQRCFGRLDELALCEIYAASESPIPGVSGAALADAVARAANLPVAYIADPAEALRRTLRCCAANDVVLALGAGSIGDAVRTLTQSLGGRRA